MNKISQSTIKNSNIDSFPLDIWSVKEIGLPKWLQQDFVWPVHGEEVFSLLTDLHNGYKDIMKSMPSEIADTLLIIYKITMKYERILLIAMAIDRLRKAGKQVSYNPATKLFVEISEGKIEYSKLENYLKARLVPDLLSFKIRSIFLLKSILNRFRYSLKKVVSFFPGPSPFYSIIGPPSSELLEYTKKSGKNLKFIFPACFLFRKKSKSVTIPNTILTKLNDSIFVLLSNITSKYEFEIDTTIIRAIIEISLKLINRIYCDTNELSRFFEKLKPSTILLVSLGTTTTRMISVAARRHGFKTIGAVHGNNIGICVTNLYAPLELSVTDIYLTPTEGSSRVFTKWAVSIDYFNSKMPDILSINTSTYKNLYNKFQKTPKPSIIKTAMVIESPLSEQFYYLPFASWPFTLDLHIRIGLFLKQQGIKSQIKLHPDRLKESSGLYEQYFDEIILDRFETVTHITDAFIFTHMGSTTFGFALTTNKPVFTFSASISIISEKMYMDLKSRCKIINSTMTGNSKITFDENEFRESLSQNPIEFDHEFVKRYMF